MSLRDLERSEHQIVDALFYLPMNEIGMRTRCTDMLAKLRKRKAELLASERNTDDVLRKSSTVAPARQSQSPLINDAEVRQMIREARDRTAAEHRLAKGVVTYDPHRRGDDAAPLAAISRALAQPYRESAGLFQLLTKRG